MTQRTSMGLMLLAAGLMACGDDDDGGPNISSGLPPEQQLESLSDDDLTKICSAGQAVVKDLFTPARICRVLAASIAENPASCEEIRKACLQDPPDLENPDPDAEPEPEPEESCEDSLKAQLEGCSATVEELETCQNDAIQAGLALVDDITCADAPLAPAEGEEAPEPVEPEKPASCVALEAKCPDLATDGEDTEPLPEEENE